MMTETDRPTIQDRIKAWGITMTAEPAEGNPNAADDWSKDASHWRCVLSIDGGGKLSVPFSMGSAHRRWKAKPPRHVADWTPHDAQRFGYKPGAPVGHLFTAQTTLWAERIRRELTEPTPPECADVLNCLAMDAGGYDNARGFEDWASEYGYDTDSRKAEATYRTVGEQTQRLRVWLGSERFAALVWETEGL